MERLTDRSPVMTDDLAKHYVERGMRNPQLIEAAIAINEDRLHEAEPILRAHLKQDPLDVAAIRLMAQLAARIGRYRDSETLLRRALELAPGFIVARSNLAGILYRQNRFEEAVATLNAVLAVDSDDVISRNLKAAALGRIGDYDEALALYEELTRRFPDHAKLWMSYGHMLKTVGRQEDGIAAYRRALDIQPKLGEVWWSLANLKTVQFDNADLAAMQAALTAQALPDEDRFHLDFALGKAFDDARQPERAFGHYAAANRLRREALDYDPQIITDHVDKMITRFTPDFLAQRVGQGHAAPDAIFILGMPRAGSTLIEQILSSHSAIEGTMELPDLPAIAMREGRDNGPAGWVDALADMPSERLAELGAEFLDRTRIQRKTDKAFFIDKLPNNWIYTGLIHLILPNAKIIDARRHPLDCCFSNFRQHFAKGQAFSYDLTDMGRYYADYVRAMAHVDTVLPGRVHRVIHEALVEEPEVQVRALLHYLGLPFEEDCLNFHQNSRAVRTASSEQVRRPLNRDGMEQWKPYDLWLSPLKDALGNLWKTYPAIS
jgi:tetratricopeptide (TPR) repeat protein